MSSSEGAAPPTHDPPPRAGTLRVFGRYLAFQLPGWAIVGALLAGAARWWQLGEPIAWGLFGLYVLKDLVLFPVVRRAYEPSSGGPTTALLGRSAVASDTLAPAGYVRVGGELWRAELREGGVAPAGAGLRIVAVRGLTLVVDLAEEEPNR